MTTNESAIKLSHNDLAIAGSLKTTGSLSRRNVQLLDDERQLPGDKGIRDLKRICVIGGFFSVGVPLLVSGKLAEVIRYEFNRYDGEVPSGFDHWWRSLLQKTDIDLSSVDDDYALHQLLVWTDGYYGHHPLQSDVLVEVIDRSHVYVGYAGPVTGKADGGIHEINYVGRIEGWAEKRDLRFISVAETHTLDPNNPKFKQDQRHLQYMIDKVRSGAIGKVSVNLSLATRIGFDMLAYYHEGRRYSRLNTRKASK